jgi:hypothetical protein
LPLQPPLNLDAVVAAWRSRVSVDGRRALDERTWADLDLDAVFEAIDRTGSTLGQAALYYRLRCAPTAPDLDAFEALVTAMTADATTRERSRRILGRLQDAHGYNVWWLGRPDALAVQPWVVVYPLLTILTVTLVVLTLLSHALVSLLVPVLGLDFVLRLATARQIADLRHVVRQLAPIVATGERLMFLDGEPFRAITGHIAADASRLRRLKTVARWASEDPLMLSSGGSDGMWMVSQLINALYEYVNMVLLLDGNAIFFTQRDLAAHRDALIRLTAAIGEVDAAISVATWRAERDDWSRPAVLDAGSDLSMSGMRHPLVENAVPNDVRLAAGRGIVVTGSNMSGKSTFLRTVGVNIVLAQTIRTCLTATYRAPVIDVQSCIGRSDDLLAGKSYYLVEVEQVVSRLRASESPAQHLFILDELFRGTNAVERIAAGEAVLRELLVANGRRKPHFVFAATHDAELVGMLDDLYDPFHFADTITDDELTFEYRLRRGPATTRNAIALLKSRGAPASVVARALESTGIIERQRSSTTH